MLAVRYISVGLLLPQTSCNLLHLAPEFVASQPTGGVRLESGGLAQVQANRENPSVEGYANPLPCRTPKLLSCEDLVG